MRSLFRAGVLQTLTFPAARFKACLLGAAMLLIIAPQVSVAAPALVLLMPFSYLDTSGEPRNQVRDHEARLAIMASELKTRLQTDGKYQVASPSAAVAACAATDSECILAAARQAHVDLIFTGAVHKVSTMATQIWVGIFDAATGKRVFYRQLTFRGDTDQAWRRSAEFLARQIETAPAKKQ